MRKRNIIFILEIILLFLLVLLVWWQMSQMWIPEYKNYNDTAKTIEIILIGIITSDLMWRRVKNEKRTDVLILFSGVPIFFVILFITMIQKYLWILVIVLFILILNYLIKDKKIKIKLLYQSSIIILMLFIYLWSFFFQKDPCDFTCGSKPMQKIENIYVYQIQNRMESDGTLQIYERNGRIPVLTPRNIGKIEVNEGLKTVKRQNDTHVELLIDEGSNFKKCILNTETWDEECEFLNK